MRYSAIITYKDGKTENLTRVLNVRMKNNRLYYLAYSLDEEPSKYGVRKKHWHWLSLKDATSVQVSIFDV